MGQNILKMRGKYLDLERAQPSISFARLLLGRSLDPRKPILPTEAAADHLGAKRPARGGNAGDLAAGSSEMSAQPLQRAARELVRGNGNVSPRIGESPGRYIEASKAGLSGAA
jgi:hypothetical protein